MSRLGTLTGPAPLRSGLDIHLERDIAGYHARKDSKRPEPLYKRESRFAQNRSEVSELDLFALHARDCEPRIIAISELVMARSFSLALVLYWEIVFDSVAWLGPRLPALLLRGGAGGIAKRDSRL